MNVVLPLFVCGSMLNGGPDAHWLAGRRRQPAKARGRLFLLPGGYPTFRATAPDAPDEGWVEGELVGPSIPEELLRILDTVEGTHTTATRRVRLDVVASLRVVPAWAYIQDNPQASGGVRCRSNRWRGAVNR
jgi:gamma-glutamylcyclotransferase (GGCT)/AIG2-like uncharacterized protein YtfP